MAQLVLAPHRTEVTERGRRRVVGALLTGAVLLVLSWAGVAARPVPAGQRHPARLLRVRGRLRPGRRLAGLPAGRGGPVPAARRATALLWLLAAGGAGGFLLATDVLYNLQHGVWFASQRGLLELVRNLATGAGTIGLFAWTWPRRAQLLAGD